MGFVDRFRKKDDEAAKLADTRAEYVYRQEYMKESRRAAERDAKSRARKDARAKYGAKKSGGGLLDALGGLGGGVQSGGIDSFDMGLGGGGKRKKRGGGMFDFGDMGF